MQIPDNYAPVSLLKRLLAIIYDLFLLIAVFFAVGIPMSILTTFIFNAGNAITENHPYYLLNQVIILGSLFIASVFFYGWFWTHGGQTLGMKTWRIMLISNNAQKISWKQAMQRYFAAILSWLVLGMGFLLSLLDDKKRCWHDMLSGSYLVQLEKAKK
jgi:uncharacterized RDD family membrane protein YckC